MRSFWRFALVCLITAGGLGFLSHPAGAQESTDQADTEDYYELMKTFVDAFEQIERNYVKDVNRKELIEAAIRGITKDLDPYSNYIGPEELTRFTEELDQQFGGIGIQVHVDPESKRLTVISPLPGGPAYREGVRAGDAIMEIEGKSTKGFTIDDAVKLIKGPPGDKVTIGVRHLNSNSIEQITIEREIIQVKTVMGDRFNDDQQWEFMLDEENKIAYIRLTAFSRLSADELQEAIDQLQKRDMKALILDLRFNPGGLLSQAIAIADLFLEKGVIVSTKGRNTPEHIERAHAENTYPAFPMVVLVNRYSASASEILSAALQDHERAVVIGERTWGKGSVQNVIQLGSGTSALKLTTASYHRPSGKNIHRFSGATEEDEWGVMPDEGFLMKLEQDELVKYIEYRRERDVLDDGGPPESEFKDAHLEKALSHLREKLGVKNADDGEDAGEEPKTSRLNAEDHPLDAPLPRRPRATAL